MRNHFQDQADTEKQEMVSLSRKSKLAGIVLVIILLLAVFSCDNKPCNVEGFITIIDGNYFEVLFPELKEDSHYRTHRQKLWFYTNKPDTLKMYHQVKLKSY